MSICNKHFKLLASQEQFSPLDAERFEDENSCINIIKKCCECLNDPSQAIVPSANGSTGFTFLCHFPENNKMTRFVAKWQTKEQCQVERIGALFFKALGFSPPIPCLIDRNHHTAIINQFGNICGNANNKFTSLSNCSDVILMPYANGNNFKDSTINSKILLLSENDQKKMLQEFGKIALLDIVLGNNDRFISFDDKFEHNQEKYISKNGSFNSGNVLLIFKSSEDSEKLQFVCPIDNCTLNMADPIQRNYDVMNLGSFFDCDHSGGSDVHSDEDNQQKVIIDFDEKIEKLNHACAWLINNTDIVSTHITYNITNELKKYAGPEIAKYESFIKLIPEHICLGIKDGLQICKRLDWNTFEKSCSKDRGTFSNRVLDLIQKNLKTVKGI